MEGTRAWHGYVTFFSNTLILGTRDINYLVIQTQLKQLVPQLLMVNITESLVKIYYRV